MKVADALAGVNKLGIDSSPYIYLVERHPTYRELVREIFQYVDNGTLIGCSSVVTLTEVLIGPIRIGNSALEKEYRDLFENSENFSLLPIDAMSALYAAELRARYQLRTPDALQLAVTLRAGCQAFLTNDVALKRVGELRVLVLNELEL